MSGDWLITDMHERTNLHAMVSYFKQYIKLGKFYKGDLTIFVDRSMQIKLTFPGKIISDTV